MDEDEMIWGHPPVLPWREVSQSCLFLPGPAMISPGRYRTGGRLHVETLRTWRPGASLKPWWYPHIPYPQPPPSATSLLSSIQEFRRIGSWNQTMDYSHGHTQMKQILLSHLVACSKNDSTQTCSFESLFWDFKIPTNQPFSTHFQLQFRTHSTHSWPGLPASVHEKL